MTSLPNDLGSKRKGWVTVQLSDMKCVDGPPAILAAALGWGVPHLRQEDGGRKEDGKVTGVDQL